MKKLITTIITAALLATTFASTAAYAENPEQEKFCQSAYGMSCAEYQLKNANPTEKAEIEKREFKAPTIAKPKTLPGPSADLQEKDPGARRTLLNKTIPGYIVGLIGFISILALLFSIIGGVRIAMSYGNEETIEAGKKQVTYSIVALIIGLLSYTIVTIIINITFE